MARRGVVSRPDGAHLPSSHDHLPETLVLRFIRFIHRDAPVLVFPEGRDPCVAWAPAFAGVAETLISALVCSCRVNLQDGSEH